MKKIMYSAALAAIALTTSCKKQEIKSINDNVTQGQWKITRFTDDGIDKTSPYQTFFLEFSDNGKVTTTGTPNVTGTWSVGKESDDDVFEKNHVKFNLYFPAPLSELNDDWHIESESNTRIELKDDSGNSDNDDDFLTLEKI